MEKLNNLFGDNISVEKLVLSRPDWLELMIKGLKKDIEEKGGIEKTSGATKELLKKWENKLKDRQIRGN